MAASEELLGLLHEAVATDLLKRVTSGEATPQELAQAIKLLKDNGIEALPTENNKLGKLAQSLPEFSTEEGLYDRQH